MMTTPTLALPGDARSSVCARIALAIQMATVSHHSWHRAGRADASTQTMTRTDAATCAPTAAPAPVFEYVAPAPVMENIAPVPAVTFDAPSQQLPPVFSTATVATDVNLDITALVSRNFPVLWWRFLRQRSLFHFVRLKSILSPCTTKSVRNRSSQPAPQLQCSSTWHPHL